MSTRRTNNPYHTTAQSYETKLHLPLVRTFRKAEQYRIRRIFAEVICSEDTVLEIGCGTGYYTRDLVKRARRVVALDDSAAMLTLVKNRLPEEELGKIEFIHSEATRYSPEEKVDIVVHIGVLDYVREWEAFLAHSLTHAKKAVIFTCPTNGLWGHVFHILGRLEGSRIQRFQKRQIETFLRERFPAWHMELYRVGLNSGWSGGLTWIGVLRKSDQTCAS
jgi:SAM-dependent methyltransferase